MFLSVHRFWSQWYYFAWYRIFTHKSKKFLFSNKSIDDILRFALCRCRVNNMILFGIKYGIKYLHKKARAFNNLLTTFCVLLCIDVGVDGEEAPPHEGRVQRCGQCRARRGRLCHVVGWNCQGRLPTGVSQNDAEGQS